MTDKPSFDPVVLHSLRDRCRAATGPDRELDARIWAELVDAGKFREMTGYHPQLPRYTASIDAAVALIERALPTANCHGYGKERDHILAYVSRNYVEKREHAWLVEAEHQTSIPLALLLALLSALIKRGGARPPAKEA